MPQPNSPPAEPAATRRARVLIADDNEPNRELLEAYLADIDCEIATAVDGADTMDQVAAFGPDVILLDVMMPKLSGFEVCQRLKVDPATSPIMILMVTASESLATSSGRWRPAPTTSSPSRSIGSSW